MFGRKNFGNFFMKLFYVTNIRIPTEKANGIQILKMSETLSKLIGQENYRLILPSRFGSANSDKGQISDEVCDRYGLKSKFQVRRLPVVDLLKLTYRWGGWIEDMAFYFETITFGLSGLIYCLFNHVDVIYTRDFYLLPFFILTRTSIYYESHYFPESALGIILHRWVLPKISGVVLISDGFRDFYQKEKIIPKRIIVAHNGSDSEFFKYVEKDKIVQKKNALGFKDSDMVIGYIGRLSGAGEDKGKSILFTAFAAVAKKYPHAKFLIVGEKGTDIAAYLRIANSKIQKRFIFTGVVPYKEMPIYFSLLNIGIIPFPDRPHFRYFMSPLKLFDYLTAGVPIITSDLPSIREVVGENNAIFVEPGDAGQLAGGIEKLIGDLQERKKMATANRILSRRFTWKKRAQKIFSFINLPKAATE